MKFAGMAKVDKEKAETGALAGICYIERMRNTMFQRELQYNMKRQSFFEMMDYSKIGMLAWFRGKKHMAREDALEYTRKRFNHALYHRDYQSNLDILQLVFASQEDFIYLSPKQCFFINSYKAKLVDQKNV